LFKSTGSKLLLLAAALLAGGLILVSHLQKESVEVPDLDRPGFEIESNVGEVVEPEAPEVYVAPPVEVDDSPLPVEEEVVEEPVVEEVKDDSL
jgi:hypothetical protein